MGGRARVRDLRSTMEKHMKSRLLPVDLESVKSGQPRWWNLVCFERNALKEEGYLRDDSPHGVWELSEKGAGFVDHLLAMPDAGEDADFNRPRSAPRKTEP